MHQLSPFRACKTSFRKLMFPQNSAQDMQCLRVSFVFLICSLKISYIWNAYKTIEQLRQRKIHFSSLYSSFAWDIAQKEDFKANWYDQCTQETEIHQLFLFKYNLVGPKNLTYTYFLCYLCAILRLH